MYSSMASVRMPPTPGRAAHMDVCAASDCASNSASNLNRSGEASPTEGCIVSVPPFSCPVQFR
jgi:hypothetical protein